MTILFLTRRFYPQIGGVETHVLEISRELVKRGNKVVIITEDHDDIKPKTNSINGIEIKRIDAGEENWFKKFRIWRELWKLRSFLDQAEIVHCHDVFFWYLPFRILFSRKKVFTTFHGHETKSPPAKRAILIRKISEWMSNGYICIGDYIKKWYGTKSTFVTYGGVDVDRIKNLELRIKNSKSKLRIVLIGRLDKDIGINTYIKALDMLKREKIGFEFIAVGEGIFDNKLKKYGKVIGFKDDITKYIKDADIVFSSSYLTMLQALALRKIVIAVYENELKEDYLKLSPFARFVYICKNADEVLEVIKSIMTNPWKSKSMTENGYQWAKQQTWDKVANMYLELWKL